MIEAALDTTEGMSFAVTEGGAFRIRDMLPGRQRGSQTTLLPWIHDLLAGEGIILAEIGRWTVGLGPGSFAGTRIGIALVRGICRQSGASLRGLASSLALARVVEERLTDGDRVTVFHDARQGQLIATVFQYVDGVLQGVDGARIPPREELMTLVQASTCVVTPHEAAVCAVLPGDLHGRLTVAATPDAGLLVDPPGCGWSADAVDTACEPIYVRPPVFVKSRPPRG